MSLKSTMEKGFTRLNVAVYRASKGKAMGKTQGMPILLLTVPGRTTGQLHTKPVVYIEDAGRYIVSGSHLGDPVEPGWFKNLRAAASKGQQARVETGKRDAGCSVTIAEGEERSRLWAELNEKAPFFEAKYQKRTERQIPLAILTPA